MKNKCEIESHSQGDIIAVCLSANCKQESRVCCSMCQTEFHKDHIEEMVEFNYLLDYITTESQSSYSYQPKVWQTIENLNNILNHFESLTRLIQEEIKRLNSANLYTFCQKLGNSYNIFTEQVGNQQWNELTQELLTQVKLINCEIIEKDSLEIHLGKPYQQFLKQFSFTMRAIDNEITFVNELKGHTDKIFAIDICEKKNLLASGSRDCTVKLWNLQNNALLKTYEDTKYVYDTVLSSEGHFLAYGGYSTTIYLVELKDLKNNDIITKLNGHDDCVTRLIFSNDETYLISGSQDCYLRVWNIQAKQEVFKLFSGGDVYGLTISRDDTFIAFNTCSSGIKIWNLKNQKLLCSHMAHFYGTAIYFSSDQQMLISSGKGGEIKLWSLKKLNQGKLMLIREFRAAYTKIQKILMSYDSKFILSYCQSDKLVKVMDFNSGEQVKFFKIYKSGKDYDVGLAITKKMDMIAYGDGSDIMIWRKE